MPDLSILICSLEKRETYLKNLCKILKPQLNKNVEVLVNCDTGEKAIGLKRNELVQQSTGDYIAFVDDDDRIADDYIAKILAAIKDKPDCIGMEGVITFDGNGPKKFVHSNTCTHWYEENNVYYRCCNHLNPVKREFAIQTPFKEINHGEDSDYSSRLRPLLKTEVFIEGPIYFYDFITNK